MNPSPKYERLGPTRVGAKGRELLAFAGCDYLGLSFDPKVIRAAQ